jgi:hypothetical protein
VFYLHIFFECLGVKLLAIMKKPILRSITSAIRTALYLYCDLEYMEVAVIHDGKLIKESIFQQSVTKDYALQLKSQHRNGLIYDLEMESKIIFEYECKLMELGFVSLDVENESKETKNPCFYEIPETFFNKKFCENEFTIQELILKSVESCKKVESELLENILIEGKITNLPGFHERLTLELKNLKPNEKISIEKETKYAPISFVQNFKNQKKFMKFSEYEKFGPEVLISKYFKN